jgi:glycosyltransferase involved in cell wall biosynthesis/MoaA/NifB/PqqE/SkfB family radical SAM enzyme
MRVLKVIHGYPPRYSAGSEVYSKILVQELNNRHNVEVFTRQENSFLPDYYYQTELDPSDSRTLLHIVNVPRTKYRDKYVHPEVDDLFRNTLVQLKPHIVHFGHLNHLSMNLPKIASSMNIATVLTLHDFWLMCPRGQFIQRNSKEPWKLCNGQENRKCATNCYSGSFTGELEFENDDIEYRENWVKHRMGKAKEALAYINKFISPSKFLMNKFIDEFDLPEEKIQYLDYGFNLEYLKQRNRNTEEEFVFGYIGTLTPQKGIHDLLHAFDLLPKDRKVKLRIWGNHGEDTAGLKSIADSIIKKGASIEWMGGYKNEEIIHKVFNYIDAIVVPSIWEENSPLVIHEANQTKVPVITANYGGMKEYVKHLENGLLFEHRNVQDLSAKMLQLIEDRTLAKRLGERGYLYSEDGNIPNIKEHAKKIEKIYIETCQELEVSVPTRPGPWRITFDTNPDHCNYKCVMCECFSPFSKTKDERVAAGIGKRVMPIETIRKIISESKDTPLREIIPSTMGEPLLYKEFDEIINLCHEYNLKLNLTTNGSFPIKGAQKWAEILIPICSDIKFSFNGSNKQVNESIMLGSQWEDQFSNIETVIKYRDEYALKKDNNRCQLTFQLTFLETNIDDLANIVSLAIDLGIDRVKGHHLWAHFDEIKNLSMRRSKESITKWNNKVKEMYQIRDNNFLPNGKKIILENIYILEEGTQDIAPGGACPFLGKEAWINTEGKFSPCCAPDNLRKGLGDFGSVLEQSIEDIFLSDQYKNLQKNFMQMPLCKDCNMRKPLIGHA